MSTACTIDVAQEPRVVLTMLQDGGGGRSICKLFPLLITFTTTSFQQRGVTAPVENASSDVLPVS